MDTTEIYKSFEQTIQPFKPALGNAADTIIEKDVSEYPVFVFSTEEIEIGIPLFEKDMIYQWIVRASTLEELVARQIVLSGKIEHFKKIYKDPRAFLCLLVFKEGSATFVFLPRK